MKKFTRRYMLTAFMMTVATAAEAGRIKLRGRAAPVITSNGGGPTATINITPLQTAITTVTATGTAPITYSKSGTNAALFSINSSTGVLALLVAQSVGSYAVTVTATNSAGHDDQAITVVVADISLTLEDNSTILQLEDNSNLVLT